MASPYNSIVCLAAFSRDFPIEYYADEVHFTETGYRLLAGAVAETIRKYL